MQQELRGYRGIELKTYKMKIRWCATFEKTSMSEICFNSSLFYSIYQRIPGFSLSITFTYTQKKEIFNEICASSNIYLPPCI